jgi:translocation and assembly module TamB
MHSERESALPPVRRRRRRNVGRAIARVLCGFFALVGLLPFLLGIIVRLPFVQAWAGEQSAALLRSQGVDASYRVGVSLFPFALELRDVRVASTTPGVPLFASDRVRAHPRLFALLAGRLIIEQIEVDAPRANIVLREGKLANAPFELPKSDDDKREPFHAPFAARAITEADVELDIDGTRIQVREIDVDVNVEDDRRRGSSFEVALAIGYGEVHRPRMYVPHDGSGRELDGQDDDAICAAEGRVRIEPNGLLVHRFYARAVADLEPASTMTLPCTLENDDVRWVELALNHFRVRFPEEGESAPGASAMPSLNGRLRARAPLALVDRLGHAPDAAGWVAVDAEVRYGADTVLPDVTGTVRAHAVRIDKYQFVDDLDGEIFIQKNVVTSPRLRVALAGGEAVLRDIEVEPLAKGIPLRARLDATNVEFAELMKELGVARHPHVGWRIAQLRLPQLTGTIEPLRLEGAFTGQTSDFLVTDKALDDPTTSRIIGVREAQLAATLLVKGDAVQFRNVRVVTPYSVLDQGFVSLGFDNDLRVDVGAGHIDLRDITPVGSIAMQGVADVEVHVGGKFNDPRLEADGKVSGFVLGELPFGTVTSMHASLVGETVTITDAHVTKGQSTYEVPSARLEFGGQASVEVDALASSTALGLRDLLSIFQLDDDPRFREYDASIGLRSEVHVALGGPEDRCGEGYIEVRADVRAKDLSLLGERFEEGDASVRFRWFDRLAGIEGAEVDIRSVSLRKVRAGRDGTPLGTVFGSAMVQRGGALSGTLFIDTLPLSRIQMLGDAASTVDGSVSGVARLSGEVAAFGVEADVETTPVRVRAVPVGASRLHMTMQQSRGPTRTIGKTRCGAPIGAPFDPVAYETEPPAPTEYVVDGELFDGQLALSDVRIVRTRASAIRGVVRFDRVDLENVLSVAMPEPIDPDVNVRVRGPRLGGELSGVLTVDELRTDDLANASLRFVPERFVLERGAQRVALRPSNGAIQVAGDTLRLPQLVFDLQAGRALHGSASMSGSIARLTRDPRLDVGIELTPIDLSVLGEVVPRIERASGTVEGSLRVRGKLQDPQADGEVRVRRGEVAVKGWPSALTDIDLEVRATESAIDLRRASARFSGGTVRAAGSIPVRNFTIAGAETSVSLRDIRLQPADGVSSTLDADLVVTIDPGELPRVTGDVTITSFEYTRSVNLVTDLAGFRVGRARRTVVDTYDPSEDSVTFDVNVRSRTPFRIRNNLIELQLVIASDQLVVTGTNQRMGLRGELRALAGGRFHFRSTDFDIKQASIRFEDPTRIAPVVDVTATTEYRRYVGIGTAGGAASLGRSGGFWRITLHAYGDADDLRLEMTSDPPLSQDDIALLLTIGMTRAEIYQLEAGAVGASFALEALATATGADRAVREVIPVIDDFRFGSAYSPRVARTVPTVTVGKRITKDVRASVTTGVSEDRELRSNIEWRLGQRASVLGSYDNVNDVSSSTIGNIGVDFRWRLEFE